MRRRRGPPLLAIGGLRPDGDTPAGTGVRPEVRVDSPAISGGLVGDDRDQWAGVAVEDPHPSTPVNPSTNRSVARAVRPTGSRCPSSPSASSTVHGTSRSRVGATSRVDPSSVGLTTG